MWQNYFILNKIRKYYEGKKIQTNHFIQAKKWYMYIDSAAEQGNKFTHYYWSAWKSFFAEILEELEIQSENIQTLALLELVSISRRVLQEPI